MRSASALFVLLALTPGLRASTHTPEPIVYRTHTHHVVSYRLLPAPHITRAIFHPTAGPSPAPPAPSAEPTVSPFSYLVRALFGLSATSK